MITGDAMAYPDPFRMVDQSYVEGEKGMSKREIFAAMAMQGLLSAIKNPLLLDINQIEMISIEAKMAADALIKRLNQPTQEG